MKKNLFTAVFLKMFFEPSFATPNPMMPATFNCTRDEGMPLVTEASINKLAVTNAIKMASNFPNKIISFPVFCKIFCPNIELPRPKLGATTKVANIITNIKLLFSL